jgi:hypothetical protein
MSSSRSAPARPRCWPMARHARCTATPITSPAGSTMSAPVRARTPSTSTTRDRRTGKSQRQLQRDVLFLHSAPEQAALVSESPLHRSPATRVHGWRVFARLGPVGHGRQRVAPQLLLLEGLRQRVALRAPELEDAPGSQCPVIGRAQRRPGSSCPARRDRARAASAVWKKPSAWTAAAPAIVPRPSVRHSCRCTVAMNASVQDYLADPTSTGVAW